MSTADLIFKHMCENIINWGINTTGEDVRAVYPDTGEKAYTRKLFGVVNRYDLRKEFPAITFRKTALKSAMDEILWIYQKKSNNINDLKSHIWDAWADENGTIGKAYGYQAGKNHCVRCGKDLKYMDQVDTSLYLLKNKPFERRNIISLWETEDLYEMNLQPCCWSVTFNVTRDDKNNMVLNMVLNQRSNDVLTANNWNVVQYAILLMMFAQVSDMVPGQLLHIIADSHIYTRHIESIKELINRKQYSAPKVSLNPDVKDFYKFTTDDLIIENYNYGKQMKFIVPV